jgi:DNA-binding transcriptional ArsR family regulator
MAVHNRQQDEDPVPTTAAEVQGAIACWTRLQILIVLSRTAQAGGDPRVNVTAIAAALETSVNHISGQLKRLLDAKLVVYEPQGTNHLYSLTAAAAVTFGRKGIHFRLDAEDGAFVTFFVPWNSHGTRALRIEPSPSDLDWPMPEIKILPVRPRQHRPQRSDHDGGR